MKDRFAKFSRDAIALSVAMIVLGAILIIWPEAALKIAVTILGIVLLALGVYSAIAWYRDRNTDRDSYMNLAKAIIYIVAGIFVLSAALFVLSIVTVVVGVVILLNGVFNLSKAMELRRMNYGHWVVSLVLAIITILLGIAVIFNPISTLEIPVIAIGIMLVYNGLTSMWINSRYRKMGR